MRGFIHYTSSSEYSPEYPYPIGKWTSPVQAIEEGEDPTSTIMAFVSMRRDIFYPVRYYNFRGIYSDHINKAVSDLYRPRVEDPDIESYVVPVDIDIDLPTITVSRPSYEMKRIGDNIYKQDTPLPIWEEYSLSIVRVEIDGIEEDIPLYIGKKGKFILLKTVPKDIYISHITPSNVGRL